MECADGPVGADLQRIVIGIGPRLHPLDFGKIENALIQIAARSHTVWPCSINSLTVGQVVDRVFAKRTTAGSLQTKLRIARVGLYLTQQMSADRPDVSDRKDGNVLHISLDGEVEVPGIRQLVVDHKTRDALYGLKNRPVGRYTHRRLYKGEPLTRIRSISALERFLEIDESRTLPVLRERRIPQFEIVLDLLKRCGVDSARRADTGFARAAKQLAENPSAESGRIRHTEARVEVLVPRRRQRRWNSGISRKYPALGAVRVQLGLQPWHERLQPVIFVRPRPAELPAQAIIQREVRLYFVAVLNVKARIRRTCVQIAGTRLNKEIGRAQ